MKSDLFYLYIMTNPWDTVFYTGVTNNLKVRVWQHKEKILPGFTKKYNINKLVYYEAYQDAREAIAREKQIKNWTRSKKVNLIKTMNPEFRDLSDSL